MLIVSLGTLYLGTLAPGLTWANAGTDGGDLITAAATGGIAHPSGYPTYLWLAGLVQHLPVGTLATRTNLLSAIFAVLAALLVYATLACLPAARGPARRLAGLVAGLIFGSAPLVWSQAVITEVYTLHAFFVAAVIFLMAWIPSLAKPGRWTGLLGLTLGLAIGNHLTASFLVPPVLAQPHPPGRWRPDWRGMARSAVGLGAGLLVYATLPLRALANPPVNWGDPVTLERLVWLVSGELYQRRLLDLPFSAIGLRLQETGSLLLAQFGLPGITLALIGLVYFTRPTRLLALTVWNALAFGLFALVYASADSYLYLIPVVLSISIWAGWGLAGLLQAIPASKKWLSLAILGLFWIFLALAAIDHWPQVDAAHDPRAEQFGASLMADLPERAIVLAEDDRSVFGLWYFHFALKQRPDLVVLASDLLHFDWYDQTLRETYPALTWPEDLFWPQTVSASNPTRPVCTVSWEMEARISCDGAP